MRERNVNFVNTKVIVIGGITKGGLTSSTLPVCNLWVKCNNKLSAV